MIINSPNLKKILTWRLKTKNFNYVFATNKLFLMGELNELMDLDAHMPLKE